MINRETIQKILQECESHKIALFLKSHKKHIHKTLLKFLGQEPYTQFNTYILKDPQGMRRIRLYIDYFEGAFIGDLDSFLEDQKSIGYIRAMEGYELHDVYGYIMAFKESISINIQHYNASIFGTENRLDINDVFVLHKLLDYSYYFLTFSFIRTRDEIINRHRDQLQAIQRYAAKVVSIFEDDWVWDHAAQSISEIYGLYGTAVVFQETEEAVSDWNNTQTYGKEVVRKVLISAVKTMIKAPVFIAFDKNNNQKNLIDLDTNELFTLVCAPILNQKSELIGILFVHNNHQIFKFSQFDRDLLSQFASFTGAVIANSRMVSEIEENQSDLHKLTTRLISIQEAERKKIAADIHDVLSQALTGIGYKALFCREIIDKDTDKLKLELDTLTEYINDTLGQSRQLIRDLRPHVLDDIGVIAAFRKFINDTSDTFNREIRFSHSEIIDLDPDRGIILFRILQEALHNIQKHAQATRVDVSLEQTNSWIHLSIKDNGRGFDSGRKRKPSRGLGLGFLTMRERAEELGGTFAVSSRPTGGCEISVTIPRNEE